MDPERSCAFLHKSATNRNHCTTYLFTSQKSQDGSSSSFPPGTSGTEALSKHYTKMPTTAPTNSASRPPPSNSSDATRSVTTRFRIVLLWILFSATNYGYGISELNALQPILTCQSRRPSQAALGALLSPIETGCIPLSESQFGLVTSLFTLGGLVSSFLISPVSKSFGWGRKTCITWSAIAGIAGSLVLGLSSGLWGLGAGRFLQGIGSGIGVVMVPIFLNEISPVALKGSIGVLNQFSIVMGIFIAQAIGASRLGSDGSYWRLVPLTSGLVSIMQLVGSFTVGLESPGWLEGEGRTTSAVAATDAADEIRTILWSPKELQSWKESRTSPSSRHAARSDEERQGLLASEGDADADTTSAGVAASNERNKVGLADLFSDPEVRPGATLVILTQLGQQLSGIVSIAFPEATVSLKVETGIELTFGHNDATISCSH